jgi:hypothetical protein
MRHVEEEVHGVYHPTMIPRCTLHALVCGMSPSGNHSGDTRDGYITCPKNGYIYIYILVHTYVYIYVEHK